MSFVMQELTEIPVGENNVLLEWKNINRGKNQFQRTWKKIDNGNPVRVLHGNGSFMVVKNAEALPRGFEASGVAKS